MTVAISEGLDEVIILKWNCMPINSWLYEYIITKTITGLKQFKIWLMGAIS
jgi:hypothetical protein